MGKIDAMLKGLSYIVRAGGALFLAACGVAPARFTELDSPSIISIYWIDGYSGKAALDNGDLLPFRLNVVDATEIEAKAFAVDFTEGKTLLITNHDGVDQYGRLIVDLEADGRDISQAGIAAGVYQPLKHDRHC